MSSGSDKGGGRKGPPDDTVAEVEVQWEPDGPTQSDEPEPVPREDPPRLQWGTRPTASEPPTVEATQRSAVERSEPLIRREPAVVPQRAPRSTPQRAPQPQRRSPRPRPRQEAQPRRSKPRASWLRVLEIIGLSIVGLFALGLWIAICSMFGMIGMTHGVAEFDRGVWDPNTLMMASAVAGIVLGGLALLGIPADETRWARLLYALPLLAVPVAFTLGLLLVEPQEISTSGHATEYMKSLSNPVLLKEAWDQFFFATLAPGWGILISCVLFTIVRPMRRTLPHPRDRLHSDRQQRGGHRKRT